MPSKNIFTNRLFIEGYAVFKKYIPKEAKKILDVGGGTGRYGIAFAREFPCAEVIVTDILTEALGVGEALAKEVEVTNMRFEQQDALHLSYADGTFDVVFCDVVIQHIPQYQNALKEMTRVLKPGGTLIVSAVNTWNIPHALYKGVLHLFGNSYEYGYERSFSPIELRHLLYGYHMERVAQGGFYFAYGLYRLKEHWCGFKLLGVVANRLSKIIDRFSRGWWSTLFGFEVFVVARKFEFKVNNSGIFHLPSFSDKEGGMLISAEFGKSIPFIPKRIYVISSITDREAVRGGHAHKKLEQIIFCINGSFELRIDDGVRYQKISLRNNGLGFRLGPSLWHSMRRFSRDCVILVLADEYYDESDYIRHYDEFLASVGRMAK